MPKMGRDKVTQRLKQHVAGSTSPGHKVDWGVTSILNHSQLPRYSISLRPERGGTRETASVYYHLLHEPFPDLFAPSPSSNTF